MCSPPLHRLMKTLNPGKIYITRRVWFTSFLVWAFLPIKVVYPSLSRFVEDWVSVNDGHLLNEGDVNRVVIPASPVGRFMADHMTQVIQSAFPCVKQAKQCFERAKTGSPKSLSKFLTVSLCRFL